MKGAVFGYVIDAYDRQARLYPALLCLLPVVAIAVGVYGAALSVNKGLGTLIASFGGIYLLISLARDSGKRREPGLFAKWGGKPTTQVLRHRDRTIDAVTKKTYHEFLGKHLNVNFPSVAEEARDPEGADGKYEAGIRWLIERTRNKAKFPFVFKENVSYGFRRNCLGLRPLGMIGSAIGALWTLGAMRVITSAGVSLHKIETAEIGAMVSLLICIILFAIWCLFMTENSVKRTAFAYADMLLRACEKLPKKRA